MLIYENLPNNFYNRILNNSNSTTRVLIIVSLDLDALCACRLLSELFTCDNILYTLKPVASDAQLYENYHKHKSEHKFIIFLNCAGSLDLSEALLDNEIEEDDFDEHEVEVFILDSRRPLDLVNVHTGKNIFVIIKEDDEISNDFEFIPKLEDIYRDEDEVDSEDEDFDREKWLEEREKILKNYSRFSFCSTSITYRVGRGRFAGNFRSYSLNYIVKFQLKI